MATTISSLRRALNEPQSHFSMLSSIQKVEGNIIRSTHFAEVQIEWQNEAWLLLMPLTPHAMRRIERLEPKKLHLSSDIMPEIRILKDEMLYECCAEQFRCDIVLEKLPKALALKDAIASLSSYEEAEKLIAALERLEQELSRLGISHNNLREENLLIDSDDKLYPIRWYYATADRHCDDGNLEQLKDKIREQTQNMEFHESYASYSTPEPEKAEYKDIRFLHEGLIAFETECGWGYMDAQRRVIIEPHYLWVNDFKEGRAEVETEQGMGLIDKQGQTIIPAIYQIVDYNPVSGNSEVRHDEKWALFDYQGKQLTPWGEYEIEL